MKEQATSIFNKNDKQQVLTHNPKMFSHFYLQTILEKAKYPQKLNYS